MNPAGCAPATGASANSFNGGNDSDSEPDEDATMNAASRSNCNDSEKLHAAAGCASASNAAATALEAAPAPTAPTAPATGAAANADDPGAPEDVEETDLAALLLPGGSFPTNVAFFGLAFSRAALGAWVKQPSPCCAAAAAAGALNAAAGIHRKDTDALRCEHALEVLAEMMDADAAAHRARIVSWLGLASEGDWAPAEAVLSAALGVDKSAGSSGAAEAPPAAAALDDSSELALAENAAKLQDSAPAAADAAAGGVSGSRGGGSGAAARRGRVRAAVAALAAEAAARSSASANASKSAGPSTVQSYGGAGLGDAESYQPSSAGDVFSRLHERLAAAASPPAASASSAAAAAASAPDSVPNDGASRRAGAAGAGAGVEAGASLSPSSDSLADCMGVLEFSFGSGKPLRPKPKLRARAPARAATIASATATTAAAGSGSATAGALASAGNAAGTSGKAPVIVQYDDDVDSDFNTSVEASQRPLEAGAAGADRLLAELSALASRLEGAARLRREKPSTAAVGTSGIVAAIHALSARHGGRFAGVQAYKLVGKACRGAARPREIVVAPGDTEKEVECQWAALRSAFGRPGSALVLHLKNHYALVYACREWVEAPAAGGNAGGYNAAASSASGGGSGGASSGSSGASTAGGGASGGLGSSSNIGGGGGHQRREVLTARRGQRPSAWVSWEELRALFVKWEGYGIVAVSLKTGDSLN